MHVMELNSLPDALIRKENQSEISWDQKTQHFFKMKITTRIQKSCSRGHAKGARTKPLTQGLSRASKELLAVKEN